MDITPAKAGVHNDEKQMGSRLRARPEAFGGGNDKCGDAVNPAKKMRRDFVHASLRLQLETRDSKLETIF